MTDGSHIDGLGINIGRAQSWGQAGLTNARFRAAVRDGDLVRVRRGLYASRSYIDKASDKPVAEHVLRAGAAQAGRSDRDAVASHHSAALIHQIALLRAPDPGVVALTCPPGRYSGAGQGLRFHSAALPPDHVTTRYGVRLTTGARTVIDLARTLPYLDAVAAADSALYAGVATRPALQRVLADCARWPGLDQARRAVEFSDGLAESVLESAARVIFAQHGLPRPGLQMDIADDALRFIGRADFLWQEHLTIAEADGMGKYQDPQRAREQSRRDIRLREAGYKVVHFTWAELFGEPDRVIARIRVAFAAATSY